MDTKAQIERIKSGCRAFLAFTFVANFVDCVVTKAIANGGGRELNSVTAFLIRLMGIDFALLFKLIAGSIILWFAWRCVNKMKEKQDLCLSFIVIMLLSFAYALVVLCNFLLGYAWLGIH